MGREKWINIGKAVAIIAVMMNHIYGSLYTSDNALYVSLFSVSLFVLLTGVTTYWSYDNSENRIGSKVVRKIPGMVCHLTWKNCVCRAYLYRKDDFERK